LLSAPIGPYRRSSVRTDAGTQKIRVSAQNFLEDRNPGRQNRGRLQPVAAPRVEKYPESGSGPDVCVRRAFFCDGRIGSAARLMSRRLAETSLGGGTETGLGLYAAS